MKGTGRTVLHGDKSENFDVEILGKVDRIGPDQNLIVAKLSNPTLEGTGVLEGMSGSPVFIEGKMVGAVAYSWGFAREAIAGITPIEEMLRIPEPVAREFPWSSGGLPVHPGKLSDLRDVARAAERFDARFASLIRPLASAGPLGRLDLPLSACGMSPSWLTGHLSESGTGLRLQMGTGGGGAAAGQTEGQAADPLLPGDMVGASLVDGDIEMTAFGTVTRVDGDKVTAFGHPFLQLGAVEYPMTRARVETLLPSLQASFKIVASTGEAGVFYQDRASGISGRLGAKARMVPVRLEIRTGSQPSRTYAASSRIRSSAPSCSISRSAGSCRRPRRPPERARSRSRKGRWSSWGTIARPICRTCTPGTTRC